ncbi:MAG: hypothetical protein WA160_01055 [Pseudobdellovibrio sp.]
MGKFTTGLFILFSFLIFGFSASNAQAAGNVCYKTVGGKKVWGGIELCGQGICSSKGGAWEGGKCKKSGSTSASSNSKSEDQINCEKIAGAYFVVQERHAAGGCFCGSLDNPLGDRKSCDNATKNDDADFANYSASCSSKGGTAIQSEDNGFFCNCSLSEATTNLGVKNINEYDQKCKGEVASTEKTGSETWAVCLDKFEKIALECNDNAKEAKIACDQTQSKDSGVSFSKDLLKMLTTGAVQSQAGKGAASECAGASLLGNTALNAMDMFKTTCNEQYDGCKTSCEKAIEESSGNGISAKCKPLFDATIQGLGDSTEQYKKKREQTVFFESEVKRINNLIVIGNKVCSADAGAENSSVNNMLKDVAVSAQAAKICECKLTASGTNCNNVVSADRCLPTGDMYGQPACKVYGNCALGSEDYSSQVCRCQRDGTLAICKTVSPTTLSNFTGVDTKPTASTGTSDFGSPGGSGADSMNLGGFDGVQKTGTDDKAAAGIATNAGLSAGSGSGGSAGGSAPSSADNGGSVGGEAGYDQDGRGGGIFGALKSFGGALFGGSKAPAASKTTVGDIRKFDTNFKSRGVASIPCDKSQMRCKNETIFEISHNRMRNSAEEKLGPP